MGVIQPVVFCASPNVKLDLKQFSSALETVCVKLDGEAMPVVVASEFLFARHVSGKYEPLVETDPRWKILEALGGLSTDKSALVVAGTIVATESHNRVNYAPVIYKGAEIKRVYKGTKGGPMEYPWVRPRALGMAHPDIFSLSYGESSETLVGVEVCNDIGNMKAALPTGSLSKWPEMYLLTSYGMAAQNIYIYGPNGAGYKQIVKGKSSDKVVFRTTKYVVDYGADDFVGMITDFALHRMKPGIFIQADGPKCRVGYKHGLVEKVTMVPPLASAAIPSAGETPESGLRYSLASIHVFPKVDLNPLEAFWAG